MENHAERFKVKKNGGNPTFLRLFFNFFIHSSFMKTTLITHIFNEEYLLPFWLEHHKPMFDNLVVIDYRSTDKSRDICKSIWPDCNIITTRNAYFDCIQIDREVMDIESKIDGIKIVLNTTEFLFSDTPITNLFVEQKAYDVTIITPYSEKNYEITTTHDLFKNLLNDDVNYIFDRAHRVLHNFSRGNYKVGRHGSYHPSSPISNVHIVWLGFYPMNEKFLLRKLQIQQNIPQHDKDNGAGRQHLFSRDKIISLAKEGANKGGSLKILNEHLYHLLQQY